MRVVALGTGPYSRRHQAVTTQAGAARGIYLQCHLNAGRGTYALIRPDARSQQGARAAALVAAALDAPLAEVTSHRSDPLYPSNAAAQAAGVNRNEWLITVAEAVLADVERKEAASPAQQ